MNKLKNKIVVITGGTRGIGLVTAKLLASEGAKVIACSRHPDKKLKVKNISFKSNDVTDYISCKKLCKSIINKYHKIDVLINNAGILKDTLTEKMSALDFDTVIKTNLYGTFNMTKAVLPYMQKQKYGNIINLSSFVAQYGSFGQANYVASKSGIEGLTKTWAKEFARHGENIRVNCVAPGVILTDIFQNTPKEILNTLAKNSCLKRLTNASEIANVILFLASNDSSCITGSIIHADAGAKI